MAQNYGFLEGLSNGANSFLNSYLTTKRINHDQRMQEMAAGVTRNENGDFVYTPEKQQEITLKQAQQKQEMGFLTPGSEENTRSTEILNQFGKPYGFEAPEGLAGKELDRYEHLLKAKAESETTLKKQKMQDDTELKKDAAKAKRTGENLKPGQKATDVSFGKEYADWVAGGGFSAVEKNLSSADNALGLLESGQAQTGGWRGLLPKTARDFITPETSKAQEAIEQTVQSSLRQILGAQFTEREGQAILSRTFNPRLSTAENVNRARAVIEQLKKQAAAKEDASVYFEQNGSLSGYKGTGLVGQNVGRTKGLSPKAPSGAGPGGAMDFNEFMKSRNSAVGAK